MNLSAHQVTVKGEVVKMGPTEFRLLELFMNHPDRAFDRSAVAGQGLGQKRLRGGANRGCPRAASAQGTEAFWRPHCHPDRPRSRLSVFSALIDEAESPGTLSAHRPWPSWRFWLAGCPVLTAGRSFSCPSSGPWASTASASCWPVGPNARSAAPQANRSPGSGSPCPSTSL